MAARRGHLSRDLVIATATELVRERGLSGLALRQVAGRLGCKAMSLYSYIDDADDLLCALVGELVNAPAEQALSDALASPDVHMQDGARSAARLAVLAGTGHPDGIKLAAAVCEPLRRKRVPV